MKPNWRTADLLAAFAIMDTGISATVLLSAREPTIAAVVIGAAAALLVAHQAVSSARHRLLILGCLVAALLIVPEATLIGIRGPAAPVQDGLLLTDAAARRLLAGRDPYGHDYLDDAALRSFFLPEFPVNPLLGHFVYPPGLLLLAVPFSAARLSVAWLWLPAMVALAGGAWLAAGRGGLIAVALNPLLLLDYLSLFNDLFFLAAGLASVGLLLRRRALAAGVLFGVALATKQSAVILVVPAVLLGWRFLTPEGRIRFAAGAVGLPLLVALPFLLWNAPAMLADTAGYFYGSGIDSFPIRGYGLAGLGLSAGWLGSRWASFPATAAQAVVLVPVAVIGGRSLLGRFTLPGFWFWTGAMGLAFFLLGRTLAPNYVTIAVLLLAIALASNLEDADAAPRLEGI